MGLGVALLLLAALQAARPAPAPAAEPSRLLFFDGRWADTAANLTAAPGRPRLLSTWNDPNSFTGWGYPSVWARRDSQPGFHLSYNGDFASDHYPRIVMLLQSLDGQHWQPMPTPTLALSPRLAKNELRAGGTDSLKAPAPPSSDLAACAAKHCGKTQGCVVCGDVERGTVFDDPVTGPLRMLLSNSSVLESTDGLLWRLPQGDAARWRPTGMDPMISVFRTHSGNITVASRPGGALRKQGRHLGVATASSWPIMQRLEPTQILPVDTTYRDDYQEYGMPVFPVYDG